MFFNVNESSRCASYPNCGLLSLSLINFFKRSLLDYDFDPQGTLILKILDFSFALVFYQVDIKLSVFN